MANIEWKDLGKPDEVRSFPHGRLELVKVGVGMVGRLILEPGWRWSNDVRPIAGTELCEAPHLQYVVSGRLRVKMKDGKETELGPGSVSHLPPGHDGWVVGNEPAVIIDWAGAVNYARPKQETGRSGGRR